MSQEGRMEIVGGQVGLEIGQDQEIDRRDEQDPPQPAGQLAGPGAEFALGPEGHPERAVDEEEATKKRPVRSP